MLFRSNGFFIISKSVTLSKMYINRYAKYDNNMPPKSKELFFPVKDEEHWNELTSAGNEKITFIDLYYPWFGRCEVLDEALRQIYLLIDDADQRIQFFYADISKIPLLKDKYPRSRSKPRFQIYKVI